MHPTSTSTGRFQSGFGNEFASEVLPGALPAHRNSPQRAAYGLHTGLNALMALGAWLEDGDCVLMRRWAEAPPGRVRIGFVEVRGTVLPARGLEG